LPKKSESSTYQAAIAVYPHTGAADVIARELPYSLSVELLIGQNEHRRR